MKAKMRLKWIGLKHAVCQVFVKLGLARWYEEQWREADGTIWREFGYQFGEYNVVMGRWECTWTKWTDVELGEFWKSQGWI